MKTWQQPFSINRVAHSLIPHRHRKLRMVAWVKVIVSYLVYIKENLYQYWNMTWLDAVITPQVALIEQALWARFGAGPSEIYIDEGFLLGPWIFKASETADPEFYMGDGTIEDTFIFNNNNAVEVDFVVMVENTFSQHGEEIAAVVHKYKLPGKSFILQLK